MAILFVFIGVLVGLFISLNISPSSRTEKILYAIGIPLGVCAFFICLFILSFGPYFAGACSFYVIVACLAACITMLIKMKIVDDEEE